MTERFIIGHVGAPFGIKGFVKVRSLSGETGHMLNLQSIIINKDGIERVYKILESAPANTEEVILMHFEGIDNPESAKTLNGALLLAGRDEAAPLGNGEFYIEDLKGLPVISNDGETIGNITDIIEGGGGDLAEIKLINGERRLIPFRKDFFPDISPAKGRVLIQNLWILD